jgi:hypothetical protein
MVSLFHSSTSSVLDFSGCTLVLPAVAVGNVGQLACDVLIATLQSQPSAALQHVGTLHSAATAATSVVCNDSFSPTGTGLLSLGFDVYHSPLRRVVGSAAYRALSFALLIFLTGLFFAAHNTTHVQ